MTTEESSYRDMYSKSRRSALPSGTEAPDFILRSTPDQWLTLSEFRGQPLVLAFYPADWSPVCGDQMTLYNEMLKEFHDLGAELIGISMAPGAMLPSRAITSYTFRFWPTSSRRRCGAAIWSLPR
jgi:peroxiredoxin